MFRRLRLRLTLLYLLAAMFLTALINGGVYALLQYSFQAAADQALERKVALGAQTLGLASTSTRARKPMEAKRAMTDSAHRVRLQSRAGKAKSATMPSLRPCSWSRLMPKASRCR